MTKKFTIISDKSFRLISEDANEYYQNDKYYFEIEGEHIEVSDGYHTMHELYQHRLALFIALTKFIVRSSVRPAGSSYWAFRSRLHFDGTMFDGGYFIVGIGWQKDMIISYHYKLEHWDEFDHCEVLDTAPFYDGFTSDDVLNRLKDLKP